MLFCEMEGESQQTRVARDSHYLHDATGNVAGNTYSGPTSTESLMQQYESLFGPAGRDIKLDSQRNKRHQRWHLPDSLKGYNSFLTDRIDGLITDATKSPFTRNILPYVYLENPDAKIKWNVYSFDEGLASRVPYESAARVLTQSKSSQAGYAIRQGLAIAMEHNFLASAAGRENFKNQLTQLVGSIQMTNDLDVHMALLQAVSYEKKTREKYYGVDYSLRRLGKMYCDLFGIYNKIPNALDLMIEEARTKLKTWGSEPPTFMLCPSNLTLQLTMSPERTDYITNGPDGIKRLAQGPDLPSYRGLSIIYSKKFNLEPGREPRNVLKRKVRVAEYYWLPHDVRQPDTTLYEFYDQETDSFRSFPKRHFLSASKIKEYLPVPGDAMSTFADLSSWYQWDWDKCDVLLLRPNIEHEMLSLIIGRGGTQELGATFWGQTELACFDDAQHGIWGMSYKYHERAIVTNERNLIRVFDVAFDGYNGGMSCDVVQWDNDDIRKFKEASTNTEIPFQGKSMLVFAFPRLKIKDEKVSISHLTPEYAQSISAGGDTTYQGYVDDKVDETVIHQSITQCIQQKNPNWYCSSKLLLNSIVHKNSALLNELSNWLRILNVFNNRDMRGHLAGIYGNDLNFVAGSPFENDIDKLANWMWTIDNQRRFQINTDWLGGDLKTDRIFNEISDTGGRPLIRLPIPGPAVGTHPVLRQAMTGFELFRTMMYSIWQNSGSNVCRYIFQDANLWTQIAGGAWTMHRFICYVLAKMIVQYCTDENLSIASLVASSLSAADTASIQDIIRQVTEYTKIDVCKFADSMFFTTVVTDAGPFQANVTDIVPYKNELNFRYFSIINFIVDQEIADPKDPYYIEIHNETMPISDLPNPLIMNDIFEKQLRKTLKLDPEGTHILSDAGEFLFWDHYQHSVNKNAEKTLDYYKNQTDSIFAHALSISASEHIRGNTCDIPCLAYHGNMKYTRYDGGYSDIKCIGHLGNSFPGVANVRDGRGVIPANTLANVFGNK